MELLGPMGVGTASCESLSSYVQRLCWHHGGMPGQLVYRMLTWIDRHERDKVGEWAPRPGRLRIGFNNNSFTLADVWVRLLQEITGRADIALLTTRAWDRLFPTRGFAGSSLAWCAPCLGSTPEPYHQLAWTIQPVQVCINCGRRLQHRCARCGKMPPVMHDRSHATRCAWCAGDLRVADESLPLVAHDHFDYWAAREIGTIVAATGHCHSCFQWDPRRAFRSICDEHKLTAGTFARAIGTGKLTTWSWLHGTARPSLPSTLRVYHQFGLSLASHLIGENAGGSCRSVPRQGEIYLRPRRVSRHLDWDSVRRELRAELQRPVSEAPTFLSVSQRLDIARRTLRAHEPVLCLQLSERHRERVRLEAGRRADLLASDIRCALDQFAAQGINPTWRELARAIGRPRLFNNRYARRVLATACAGQGAALQESLP